MSDRDKNQAGGVLVGLFAMLGLGGKACTMAERSGAAINAGAAATRAARTAVGLAPLGRLGAEAGELRQATSAARWGAEASELGEGSRAARAGATTETAFHARETRAAHAVSAHEGHDVLGHAADALDVGKTALEAAGADDRDER